VDSTDYIGYLAKAATPRARSAGTPDTRRGVLRPQPQAPGSSRYPGHCKSAHDMRLAVRGQQSAVRPDDLLEYRHAERAPQLFALADRQRGVPGGFEHDHGVGECRRPLHRGKPEQLLAIRRHGGRRERGYFFRPSVGKNPDGRPGGRPRLAKTNRQHGRARSRIERIPEHGLARRKRHTQMTLFQAVRILTRFSPKMAFASASEVPIS
jgi:hypothetical protein